MSKYADIEKLYETLRYETEDSADEFDNIYYAVQEGNEKFRFEDIILLCRVFLQGYGEIEPSQIVDIVKLTFDTINAYNLEEGFKELIKGLEEILNHKNIFVVQSIVPSEEIMIHFLSRLMFSYEDKEFVKFGNVLKGFSGNIVLKILEIVLEHDEDKGQILTEAVR